MTNATDVHPAFSSSKIEQGGRGCPYRFWGEPRTGESAYINKGQTWWRRTWVDSENGVWGEPRTGDCLVSLSSNTRVNLPKSERGRGGRGCRGTGPLLPIESPLSDHFQAGNVTGFLISLEGIETVDVAVRYLKSLNTSARPLSNSNINP